MRLDSRQSESSTRSSIWWSFNRARRSLSSNKTRNTRTSVRHSTLLRLIWGHVWASTAVSLDGVSRIGFLRLEIRIASRWSLPLSGMTSTFRDRLDSSVDGPIIAIDLVSMYPSIMYFSKQFIFNLICRSLNWTLLVLHYRGLPPGWTENPLRRRSRKVHFRQALTRLGTCGTAQSGTNALFTV